MKKMFLLFLALILLAAGLSMTALAADGHDPKTFELPKPQAPNYFVFTDGDEKEGTHDDLRMIMVVDPEVAMLAAEYDSDSTAFYEKYGLYSFEIVMQYDISLDDENSWQHTGEWDTQYYVGSYGNGFQNVSIRNEMMEDFEFFWLTYYEGPDSDTFVPLQPAITTYVYRHEDWNENIYSFDMENHSLYIRCRYYMEWETYDKATNTIGEKQSRFSEWSDSAVFGKNSTQIVPETPTVYAAPMLSDMKILPPDESYTYSRIQYFQATPESVWMTNIYYQMTDDGYFDGLETQISVEDGEWQTCETADSWGDWCLYNGIRQVFYDELTITEDSHIKIRVRFNGSHGPSEWSNVLEINGKLEEQTQAPVNDPTKAPSDQPTKAPDSGVITPGAACSLCGFCSVPFGLCLLIWIVIILVAILLLILIISIAGRKKRKCPNCKTKLKKKDKFCPRCGYRFQ